MIKTEAKLATVIRRIVGRSARVVLGCPHLGKDQKAYSKPYIYLRLNQFCDTTAEISGSSHTQRRIAIEGKYTVNREERPGRISIQIDIISDDYVEAQELRQQLVGGVFEFLGSLRTMTLSDPKDPNLSMLFKDIVPSMQNFVLGAIPACHEPLYCGQIQFVLNGFLHLRAQG